MPRPDRLDPDALAFPAVACSPVARGLRFTVAVLFAGLLISCGACNRYRSNESAASDPGTPDAQPAVDHGHLGSSMGGVISSIGRDQYHAEAVLQEEGVLTVYILAEDETRLHEVPVQTLTAYIKHPDGAVSAAIVLKSDRFPDDAEQMTSRFSGTLPESFRGQPLYITMPGLRIDGKRFTVRFQIPHDLDPEMPHPEMPDPEMPDPIADDEATELYLTAGGRYTEADIDANGRITAAEKYAGFRASHDANPAPGDPICPISRTKAHPECSWIIGGETYQFCCPPCIDEFLAIAKSETEAKTILPAREYVQPRSTGAEDSASE